MFTGIIDSLGKVKNLIRKGKNLEITIISEKNDYLCDIKIGASISVNGVCLTVSKIKNDDFTSFISSETASITNLKFLKVGDIVNLEKSLKIGDRLDGHFVQGHIDGLGVCIGLRRLNYDYELQVKLPNELLKYVVNKGSIALNGVSLTVAKIKNDIITIAIIPETYNNTNIKYLKPGSKINIETDILGKYQMSSRLYKNAGSLSFL